MGSIFSGDYSEKSSNRSKGILKPKKSNSDLINVASFDRMPQNRQERESLLKENSQSIRRQKISDKKHRHYKKHAGYDRPVIPVAIDEIPKRY